MHFWLSFFHQNLVVGKVKKYLFYWRQHPGQQTRLHGRLSIENLRKCKCHFLCTEKGFIFGNSRAVEAGSITVEVWSTGKTLLGWVEDVRAELANQNMNGVKVISVDWTPGRPYPDAAAMTATLDGRPLGEKRVRLFAFGMAKARQGVREQLGENWDDAFDIFVA